MKVFRLDITPEQAQGLAAELSRAAEAGLFHPSIVEPIAAGVQGTVAYRAEEYVAAQTLDVAFREYAPASLDTALPIVTQLAGAIDFARAVGVGHGALHPRDIFVTEDEVRATGFGVVDALDRVGLRAPVRRPYSAPERIEGRPWSAPADVFSLAAIVYELLTARRPSGTGTDIGTLAGSKVGHRAGDLLAVLARAMDDDPARRPQTALAFAAELEAAARSAQRPAAAAAVPAAEADAGTDEDHHDEHAERDEDEAHHVLTLRERAEDDEAASLAADAEPEAEAEADRELIEAAAMASPKDAPDPLDVDEFRAPAAAGPLIDLEPEPEADARPALAGAAASVAWRDDRASRTPDARDDVPAAFGAPAAVVPAERSRVLPLAAMLSLGLLIGFLLGYGTGTRERRHDSVAAVDAAPPAAPTGAAGRDYSEQAVAQPTAGTRPEPAPVPPPVPVEAPPRDPEPAPRAESGVVIVRSTPTRAGVLVNGQWRGRTPLTLDKLPFGKYSVRIAQPGYVTGQEDFALSSGQPARTVSLTLERQLRASAPTAPRGEARASTPRGGIAAAPRTFTGSIYVDSRPQGARVFIDGRAVGTTPVTVPDVAIGSHVVRLELADHRAWTASRQVSAGEVERVTGSLERIR